MKITRKKIGNEIGLFLICFGVSVFILFPLLFIGSKQWDFGEYLPALKNIFDLMIFPETVKKGLGVWFAINIPWLFIQSIRGLFLVFSLMKQAFVVLVTKKGEMQAGRIFLIGLILGGSLLGRFWWWGAQPNDPYYSVKGTNPENWHHSDRDNTSWKTFDVKECHQSVKFKRSKEFITWEDRLSIFDDCMLAKGYKFKDLTK